MPGRWPSIIGPLAQGIQGRPGRSGLTESDPATFTALAPEWAARILLAACETGLRPGDLIKLSRAHIEDTPGGRRIRIKTNRRGRVAHIPALPRMAATPDATPKDRLLILTNTNGQPLTEHRASEGVRQRRGRANCRTGCAFRMPEAPPPRGL